MKNDPPRDAEPHVFDQTNGMVDLSDTSEAPNPEEEQNVARRISSMGAMGITFGNGTR